MYGAKATQIAKAALDTWAAGKTIPDKTKAGVVAGVHLVAEDQASTLDDLGKVPDFPKALYHAEFVNLARSLANNPLVA